MFKRIFLIVFIVTFFMIIGLALGQEKQPLSVSQPDLVVEKIEFKKVSQNPQETAVKITFVVKNASSAPTSSSLTTEGRTKCPTGCFLVKVNATYYLADKAVSKQIYEDKCKPINGGETATFTFGDVVKSNIKKASYNIIVDSQNWIKESNEVNNEKSESLQLQ